MHCFIMVYMQNKNGQRIGRSKLVVFNETAMEQPLSDTEVNIITKQHDKKDWGYKCNDQPMCSLCDKKLCKSRKFGIGQEIVFPKFNRFTSR